MVSTKDVYIGHCIHHIGNSTKHIISPYNRKSNTGARDIGYDTDTFNLTITNGSYPIATSADFRMLGGGITYPRNSDSNKHDYGFPNWISFS